MNIEQIKELHDLLCYLEGAKDMAQSGQTLNVCTKCEESIKQVFRLDRPITIRKEDEETLPLDTPIGELNMSVRVTNCLKSEGIQTLRDLLEKTLLELMRIPNLGSVSLREITDTLKHHGFELQKGNY